MLISSLGYIWYNFQSTDSCLPNKMDGLVAGGQDGLASYKEGGLPSVAFIHHQDHVEKLVENPAQRLNKRHQFY